MGYIGILLLMYPEPYSIYLRGTIGFRVALGLAPAARLVQLLTWVCGGSVQNRALEFRV